jgi:hypothetical protein
MTSAHARITGLAVNNLPQSCLRVLRDGLSDVPDVQRLGGYWSETLTRRGDSISQPVSPGSVRKQVRRVLDQDAEELEPGLKTDLELVHAVAYFEHQFRLAINRIRALVSAREGRRMPIPEILSEELSEKIQEELTEAAQSLLQAFGRGIRPRKATRMLVGELAGSDEIRRTIGIVLMQCEQALGADGPFLERGGWLYLRPGWEKKHPTDDSRGMLFSLAPLGVFLAQTRWEEGAERLGLDGMHATSSAPTGPIPTEWRMDGSGEEEAVTSDTPQDGPDDEMASELDGNEESPPSAKEAMEALLQADDSSESGDERVAKDSDPIDESPDGASSE